jgi:hypothetical protein
MQNSIIEFGSKKSRKNYSVERMPFQHNHVSSDIGEIANHTILNSSNSEIEIINGLPINNDLQKQIDQLK